MMEEVNTQLWLPTLLWIIRLKLQFHQYAIKCLLHLMYLLKLSRWEDLEHLLKKLVGLKIMQKLFIKNTESILQILEFWFLLVLLLSEFFKHFCPNNFGIFIWNFFLLFNRWCLPILDQWENITVTILSRLFLGW